MCNLEAISERRSAALATLAAILVASALGCASTRPERQQISDSFEPLNRSLFRLNEALDDGAIAPLARGWKQLTPAPLRQSLANAERNLAFPARFVALLGQAKLEAAGEELGRFVLNSTLGIGGLLDPASEAGLAKHDDDLGIMLASWHVPPGPYVMLPAFGPSTARDAAAGLVAMAMNPLAWTTPAAPPIGVLLALNRRAELDDRMRIAKQSALDYYVFVRDAYIQSRTSQIRGSYAARLAAEDATASLSFPEDLYDLRAGEASTDNATR